MNFIIMIMTNLMKRMSSPKSMGIVVVVGVICLVLLTNFSTVAGWFGYETRSVLKEQIVELEESKSLCERINEEMRINVLLLEESSHNALLGVQRDCKKKIEGLEQVVSIRATVEKERDEIRKRVEVTDTPTEEPGIEVEVVTPEIVQYNREALDEQSAVNHKAITSAYDRLIGEYK